MLAGTFREWVDEATPGAFRVTDELGITTTVQLAEDKKGQITYEVFLGYQTHDALVAREYVCNTPDDIVSAGLLAWEIRGEVTDG